jgi:DHA3 family tetracycline resistance protein-like MFS transporter
LPPYTVYLILQFAGALLFSSIFTVDMVYQVTVVNLTPLQLVLMGTILEATIFVFEIPTGILADLRGRRISVVVGYAIMGAGFLVEGSLPFLWSVALAQVLWGFGYTFTSGAVEAWIADEVGEERAGVAFLRGSQAAGAGALVAIPLSVALGTVRVALPILIGGGLLVTLALWLALVMTEHGFKPVPAGERGRWRRMVQTVLDARQMTARQPALLILLAIGLFYGLYSEGLDRLWTAHLLDSFPVPFGGAIEPVIWVGAIRGVLIAGSIVATEVFRRRVDLQRSGPIGRALVGNAVVIIGALAAFGLTHSFWVAVGLFWLLSVARDVTEPLQAAWFNLQVDDPQVRATMFSVRGQVDAIGQIGGGPAVGLVGNASIRAALVTCAVILSPVLPLYGTAIRRSEEPKPSLRPAP